MTAMDLTQGCTREHLLAAFGQVDIYLFDQILRGRIDASMTVLDAGCGGGRNAHFLLRCGANLFGVDADGARVAEIQALAARLAPSLPRDHFGVADLAELAFDDGFFDCVICSAVLHFARDEAHFEAMVHEMWRVLAPGGIFFARLASTIGIESRLGEGVGRWFALPDGSERFLVDEDYLLGVGNGLGGRLLDPLKTTNVQNLRAMTTWVLGKDGASDPGGS